MESTTHLGDRYTIEEGTVYLSGLQALVRLPIDAVRRDAQRGVRTRVYISGYEGSPLAGYDLELARQHELLSQYGIIAQPAVNEELAVNAVQGSQLAAESAGFDGDGVIGIWYGKAPGLDRATDALRHANLGGAHPKGGAVVVVGDDATAKSSTVPSSSEMALAELGMPVFSPSDPQDVLDLGIHGVAMSRACGLWVGIKIATNVADGSASASVAAARVEPTPPCPVDAASRYVHTVSAQFVHPTVAELEASLFRERLDLARLYATDNKLNPILGAVDNAAVGIVVPGSNYLDVRQALGRIGLGPDELAVQGVRLLKLELVWPLVPEQILRFADGLAEVLVVEEKRSFIEAGIKEILYGLDVRPLVSGKFDPNGSQLLRPQADLTADLIAKALRARLGQHIALPAPVTDATMEITRPLLPLLSRTPFFCSGCPHNRSTQAPAGSAVGAGMGCSGMVTIMPEQRVGEVVGMTQMGGEGALWIGMAPFVARTHMIQNMGDGTFHHSGSLAIRAAVASGTNITFKLLYNSAVAMTGGQEAVGAMTVPQIVRELLAEGVARIDITTDQPRRYKGVHLPKGVRVRHRDELITTQEELAGTPGVTVLIHDQECATELRRKRKRKRSDDPAMRIFINQRVCEGCGDCGEKSNCLSVQPVDTEYGRKTQVHQASCNKDYSCLDGDCPSFLTITPKHGIQPPAPVPTPELDADELGEPQPVVAPDDFSIRITGIGGTGVVTVAQVIATAATLSGRYVQALDQTGLAQKGGAVVSDIRISTRPTERTNKLGAGEADLYLGCDLLVAAAESNLFVSLPLRTVAVVNTAKVPTGAMVTDPTVAFPQPDQTVGQIKSRTRSDIGAYVDAREMTLDLFGDDQFANVFLVGVAYQSGTIPLPPSSIERAIVLNGVAVAPNIQAFRRGRQSVSHPDALRESLVKLHPPEPTPVYAAGVLAIAGLVRANEGSALAELVRRRTADLIEYQDHHYARHYCETVETVRAAEAATAPNTDELAMAVAQYLHKLMAYKDEYEVARLSLDPTVASQLWEQFGEAYSVRFRLHPPALRALGFKRKVSLGPWFRPIFVILRSMRRLRHTPLDPFGYAQVRRTERELIANYEDALTHVAAHLTVANLERALEIARLPDLIRGFEHIKLRNVDKYRLEFTRQLDRFDASLDPQVVRPDGGST